MSKKASKKPITPESVILSRRQKLVDNKTVISFLSKLIILVVVLIVLFNVVFGLTPMRGNDMKPSFHAGDILLYYRMGHEYRSGDVVVYKAEESTYVGRVVAVGGDEIEITEDSTVRINGSTMIETDVYFPTPKYGDEVQYPVKLSEGEYFILCDFRDGGKDSRYFGKIPTDRIEGQVISAVRRSQL